MPITFDEKVDSRQVRLGEQPGVDLLYTLRGTSDDATAVQTVELSTPLLYQGFWRQSIDVRPVWVDADATDGQWDVLVRYGVRTYPADAQPVYSFDYTGGVRHVDVSQATAEYDAPGVPARSPEFRGVIGFDGQRVEGVDLDEGPGAQIIETHQFPATFVTQAYRVVLYYLRRSVNHLPFKGCAAGECLFLGASGQQRGSSNWEITYRFAVSGNQTGLQIGSIGGIFKPGWDYLETEFEAAVDGSCQRLLQRPIRVFVHKVFPDADLSLLGIGV